MDVSVRMALKSAAPVVPFSSTRPSPAVAAASWLLQSLIVAVFLTFVLESGVVARSFVSQSLWLDVVQSLGGEVTPGPEGVSVVAPFVSLLLVAALAGPIWNSLAAALVNRMSQQPFVQEFGNQCLVHAIWTWPVALWTTLWIVNLLLPGGPLFSLLVLTGNLAVATMLAGGISTVIRDAWPVQDKSTPTCEQDSSQS